MKNNSNNKEPSKYYIYFIEILTFYTKLFKVVAITMLFLGLIIPLPRIVLLNDNVSRVNQYSGVKTACIGMTSINFWNETGWPILKTGFILLDIQSVDSESAVNYKSKYLAFTLFGIPYGIYEYDCSKRS